MAKQKSRAGVKALIVVAAVGSTLGGWVLFASANQPKESNAVMQPARSQSQSDPQAIVLPTLVPIDDAIAASKTAAAQPPAPRPQPQELRSITIPQMPMAMSRSSR